MAVGSGSSQYATRRYVLWTNFATFLAVCAAIFAFQHFQDKHELKQLHDGCERTNVLRGATDDFLKAARDARKSEGNFETAQSYQDIIDRIESVEHAKKSSAEVNCDEAYTR